ncbi:MAG: DegT/DnrJ/EryC1/StrS family aminotransferase [Ignavibacteriales bacterium]|nr:DegT/DnrJ/EryC1/StrS family aminotransferase [Ignavibacteriales bacterium]
MKPIHMVDVVGQYKKIKKEIDEAAIKVIESGQYILGKEVLEFENEIAQYLHVNHGIGCASGTDALMVSMMALGIGQGDEVITTPFTFAATIETIMLLGAKPIYVDIDPKTFNLDPSKIGAVVTKKTKAIIPVHLYGQTVDMDPLVTIARQYNIPMIEDMCQAIGADYKGKKVGGIGAMGCLSFFPSKNLGAFGDAGMVVTNDAVLAEKLRMIVVHGSRVRYKHEIIGVNSRLDALQAAMLRVKLRYLDQWIDSRRKAALVYNRLFVGSDVEIPFEAPYGRHVFHQYTIRIKNRDRVAQSLSEKKIPYGIYYPISLHMQEAYKAAGKPKGAFPITENATDEVLSLPMHTELDEDQQKFIVQSILESMKK